MWSSSSSNGKYTAKRNIKGIRRIRKHSMLNRGEYFSDDNMGVPKKTQKLARRLELHIYSSSWQAYFGKKKFNFPALRVIKEDIFELLGKELALKKNQSGRFVMRIKTLLSLSPSVQGWESLTAAKFENKSVSLANNVVKRKRFKEKCWRQVSIE